MAGLSTGAKWLIAAAVTVVVAPLVMITLGPIAFTVVMIAAVAYTAPQTVRALADLFPDRFPEKPSMARAAFTGGLAGLGVLLLAMLLAYSLR